MLALLFHMPCSKSVPYGMRCCLENGELPWLAGKLRPSQGGATLASDDDEAQPGKVMPWLAAIIRSSQGKISLASGDDEVQPGQGYPG